MVLGGRLDGHLVQGHVDGLTRVVAIQPRGGFQTWRLSLPTELADEVALKGSVALSGVSLTVSALRRDWFEVALIPETLAVTSLGHARAGTRLHVEADMVGKWIERLLAERE